jgi:hypothetical protein
MELTNFRLKANNIIRVSANRVLKLLCSHTYVYMLGVDTEQRQRSAEIILVSGMQGQESRSLQTQSVCICRSLVAEITEAELKAKNGIK